MCSHKLYIVVKAYECYSMLLILAYRYIEVYRLFCIYFRLFVRICEFCNGRRCYLYWWFVALCLDYLFDNLTVESYLNVDDRNHEDVFQMISREPNSIFQLTIRVFLSLFYVGDWEIDWIPESADD